LDVLSGDEAQIVLKDLLSSRPDLISEARRAANALLATVSFADVATGHSRNFVERYKPNWAWLVR
jgi:hypothetical protein